MSIVTTQDLIKIYRIGKKSVHALNKLSMDIKKGEIFGILGPNGAGKTTTLRILSTIISPTSGEAKVCGFDVRRESLKVRKTIAYMPQGGALHPYLKVFDQFFFYFLTHGMDKKTAKALSVNTIKKFDLEQHAFKIPMQLSGGLKRIVDTLRVLMSRKELIFLDEPTVGLDPMMKKEIWQLITQVNKEEKTTIVITTHNLEEAEKLCKRVAFINSGKLVLCETPEEIKKKIGGTTMEVQFSGESVDQIKEAIKELQEMPDIINVSWQGSTLSVTIRWKKIGEIELFQTLKKHSLELREFRVKEATLEDVYLSVVKGGESKCMC